MSHPTILLVDDEQANLESLSRIFKREGFAVITASDGKQGLEELRRHPINVLVTDLVMPGMTGVDLLKAARSVAPETEVVLMTAYGTVENAVEAMKQGAYDFVTKPLKRAHIVGVVRRALEKQSLVVENRALRAQLEATRRRPIVGNCLVWRRTMDVVLQAAPSSATVLLMGESGTGKELLARALHDNSSRASEPFIAVNCAAIPESILEAELFGYEKGAFTGAVSRKDGRFSLAHGGTLFLDEIGEISQQVQVKLLRVLQEGEFDRLGGKTERVDIRLVAATNRDLSEEVRSGRFREDLYYRLNVIGLQVPPLRERVEDVPLLADVFLRRYGEKNSKQIRGFTRGAMDRLTSYLWPGNVRELENVVERAVVLTKGQVIDEDDLPQDLFGARGDGRSISVAIGTPLEEVERRLIFETLRHTKGDKRLAAQLLGIATRTIYRRLEAVREDDVDGGARTPTDGDSPELAANGG
ncbi:MAG: DNA-binding response regulator [Proteobacteria bacterium]|nr:MAG: DNA-binding response regulator [Pseudomonadota bacterium]PIE17742.1 MAG: DNA-binding response regulator [Pseudomonadota bacterium]